MIRDEYVRVYDEAAQLEHTTLVSEIDCVSRLSIGVRESHRLSLPSQQELVLCPLLVHVSLQMESSVQTSGREVSDGLAEVCPDLQGNTAIHS